jgi:hypothetical protein
MLIYRENEMPVFDDIEDEPLLMLYFVSIVVDLLHHRRDKHLMALNYNHEVV